MVSMYRTKQTKNDVENEQIFPIFIAHLQRPMNAMGLVSITGRKKNSHSHYQRLTISS